MSDPVYWITTDLPDFCTCGVCGALVWQLGEGVDLHKKWHKGGFVVDMLFDERLDSDGQPWTDDIGVVWQPKIRRHLHPMPPAADYDYGSVARCVVCQSVFVRETSGYLTNPVRKYWRQIGWFGVTWRRLLGRIPAPSPKATT